MPVSYAHTTRNYQLWMSNKRVSHSMSMRQSLCWTQPKTITARCKEHKDTCLDEHQQSALAEHSIKTGHHADCSDTPLSDRTWGHTDCLTTEQLNAMNYNTASGFILTLSRQTTYIYIYIYICRAVSPLNSQTATKVAGGGFNSGV